MSEFPDNVLFLREAQEDLSGFDHSQQVQIIKAIQKVSGNPRPKPEGYGNPLRNELAGLCKIKLKKAGIRIVYRYMKATSGMLVVVVAMRNDEQVYKLAERRIRKHPDIFLDV